MRLDASPAAAARMAIGLRLVMCGGAWGGAAAVLDARQLTRKRPEIL
jgi:hypothetical protein